MLPYWTSHSYMGLKTSLYHRKTYNYNYKTVNPLLFWNRVNIYSHYWRVKAWKCGVRLSLIDLTWNTSTHSPAVRMVIFCNYTHQTQYSFFCVFFTQLLFNILCSIFCTQYSELNILYSILCTQYSELNILYSIFCTQYSELNILNSIFCTQYYVLNILNSIFCTQYHVFLCITLNYYLIF